MQIFSQGFHEPRYGGANPKEMGPVLIRILWIGSSAFVLSILFYRLQPICAMLGFQETSLLFEELGFSSFLVALLSGTVLLLISLLLLPMRKTYGA